MERLGGIWNIAGLILALCGFLRGILATPLAQSSLISTGYIAAIF
ncbi:hypothetical protein ABN584_17255 [Gloeocapsa sp. BRSZ]